jgi:hypothetical protein
MITSMSNMIRAEGLGLSHLRALSAFPFLVLLSSCSLAATGEGAEGEGGAPTVPVAAQAAAPADREAAVLDPAGPALGQTGAPAPRLPSDEPVSETTRIISKVELAKAFNKPDKIGCFITFAYRGFQPETLISDSPCTELHLSFVDQADLQRQNDWERLDSFQQGYVKNSPDGKVLYVEGEFAAAIYPIGYAGTTEEIWVSD